MRNGKFDSALAIVFIAGVMPMVVTGTTRLAVHWYEHLQQQQQQMGSAIESLNEAVREAEEGLAQCEYNSEQLRKNYHNCNEQLSEHQRWDVTSIRFEEYTGERPYFHECKVQTRRRCY